MTYRELWARANALAAELERRSGASGALVGICGHKEPGMFVGFLGTVLSGRGYLPLSTACSTRFLTIHAVVFGFWLFSVNVQQLAGTGESPDPTENEEPPLRDS